MVASSSRRRTGPDRARDSMTLLAQGCRRRTSWAEIVLRRIEALQSGMPVGTSNSVVIELDHPVEDVVLVRHVVVERHRLDAEPAAEAAHREGLDAVLVRELDRRAEDPLP